MALDRVTEMTDTPSQSAQNNLPPTHEGTTVPAKVKFSVGSITSEIKIQMPTDTAEVYRDSDLECKSHSSQGYVNLTEFHRTSVMSIIPEMYDSHLTCYTVYRFY